MLEGSVRKAGNRLRMTAQLVNVADGYQLWSERYDRELEDVFAVQDEIAGSVVERVVDRHRRRARGGEPRGRLPGTYRRMSTTLRGRQLFHQFRKKQIQLARRMFERAIELDSSFTLAYAGAADCSSILYMYFEATEANLRQADAWSRSALELGPDLAEAHAARGLALTLRGSFETARREFESAIALDPRLYETWYFYARVCFQKGQLAEAARMFEQAATAQTRRLSGGRLSRHDVRGDGAGDESKATGPARARDPGAASRAVSRRCPCLVQRGHRPRPTGRAGEGLAVGRPCASALDPEDGAVLYGIACVYALLGEQERALDALERGIQAGFGRREWAERDPELASLHESPRFWKLLDRCHATSAAPGRPSEHLNATAP